MTWPHVLQDLKILQSLVDDLFDENHTKDDEIEDLQCSLKDQKDELDCLKYEWTALMEAESLKRRSEEFKEEVKRKVPKILETKFYSPPLTDMEKDAELRAKNDMIGMKYMGLNPSDLIALLG